MTFDREKGGVVSDEDSLPSLSRETIVLNRFLRPYCRCSRRLTVYVEDSKSCLMKD